MAMNAWRKRAGGLEPPHDSQISVWTVDRKGACFPNQHYNTWDSPLGGSENLKKKKPSVISKIQSEVDTNRESSGRKIHSFGTPENVQMRAFPHAKVDIEDPDLQSTLLRIIDGDPSMSLEHGIDRLDTMIKRTTAHVNQLLSEPISKSSAGPSDWHDPSPEILWPIHTISSKVHAAAMPRFARLFEGNHLITKQTGVHPKPPISVTKRPRDETFQSRREPSGNLTLPLYQRPQESPFWLINKAHHTALMPALHADVHQRMRKLCSYLAEQAQDYYSAEMKWRGNLRTWQGSNSRNINHGAENRIDSDSVMNGEHKIEDNDGTSCASLFSLNSSRTKVTSSASHYALITNDDERSGGLGAPTRAQKTFRAETTDHEHLVSNVLASSAKEARFERGSIDDDNLPLPLPISVLASNDTQIHESTKDCRFVLDPMMHEAHFAQSRQWSDLEKCIFLDKFLQYPKRFGKIAAFFSCKDARDCAQLYYDSKYDIDYKALLREHQQRRRGVRICWEITAKAVEVFGGALDHDPQRNMVWFRLPSDNFSMRSARIHPPQDRSTCMFSPESSSSSPKSAGPGCLAHHLKQTNKLVQSSVPSTAYKNTKSMTRTRSRSQISPKLTQILPGFTLGGVEAQHSGEDMECDDDAHLAAQAPKVSFVVANNIKHEIEDPIKSGAAAALIQRRQSRTWSLAEKSLFLRVVAPHGENWALLACLIPTKSEAQIQTYLMNYKNRLGLETRTNQTASGCPGQYFDLAFPVKPRSDDSGPFPEGTSHDNVGTRSSISSSQIASSSTCMLNPPFLIAPSVKRVQDDKHFSLNSNAPIFQPPPRLRPDWWPSETTR